MLKVCKFGGSSLADAEGFLRVKALIEQDDARRVIVVSAAGKRHPADKKITDLLYLCHAALQYGACCREQFSHIQWRYSQIRSECGLGYPVERELAELYGTLSERTAADYLVSRGEYFSARLMAELLGYSFVDAAEWLCFSPEGRVEKEKSYARLRELADGRRIVTPGFYGRGADGEIRTFSRGGSDVTGALAAAALSAQLYENWSDVDGVLAAAPALVPEAKTVRRLSYAQLQLLSDMGMQVMHRSAIEPLREKNVPMQIRNTFRPACDGTSVDAAGTWEEGVLAVCGSAGTLAVLYHGERPGIDLRRLLLGRGIGVLGESEEEGVMRLNVSAEHTDEAVREVYAAIFDDSGKNMNIIS